MATCIWFSTFGGPMVRDPTRVLKILYNPRKPPKKKTRRKESKKSFGK